MAVQTYEGPFPVIQAAEEAPVETVVLAKNYAWCVERPVTCGAIGITYDPGDERL